MWIGAIMASKRASKKGKSKKTVAIVVFAVLLLVGACSQAFQKKDASPSSGAAQTEVASPDSKGGSQAETNAKTPEKGELISDFVDSFNAASPTKITDTATFDPQDRNSGHYRTEYRLGAFEGSTGMHGKIGDLSIDVVEYGSYNGYWNTGKLRVYIEGAEAEAHDAFRTAAKVLDPKLPDDAIQGVMDEYANNKAATDLLFAASRDKGSKTIQNDYLKSTGQSEGYIDAQLAKTTKQ